MFKLNFKLSNNILRGKLLPETGIEPESSCFKFKFANHYNGQTKCGTQILPSVFFVSLLDTLKI